MWPDKAEEAVSLKCTRDLLTSGSTLALEREYINGAVSFRTETVFRSSLPGAKNRTEIPSQANMKPRSLRAIPPSRTPGRFVSRYRDQLSGADHERLSNGIM